MSNAHSTPLGDGSEYRSVSDSASSAPILSNQVRFDDLGVRVPLSKIDRSDPILRAYLAPPAEPPATVVSPLATAARRESAGIGFATWAFLFLIFLIGTGDFVVSLGLSLVGGFLARFAVYSARRGAIRVDEAKLNEQVKSQQGVYQARRAAWERLSYCPDQRCVVDEKSGAIRPLHAAHELLVMSTVVSQATNAPAEQ